MSGIKEIISHHGSPARARVRTMTSCAPAFISTFEHSDTVAPVVITSSMSRRRRPLISPFTSNAFLRFVDRSFFDRPIWGRVSFFLHSISINKGTCNFFESTFAMSNDWLKPLSLSPLRVRGTGSMPSITGRSQFKRSVPRGFESLLRS